MSSMGGEVPAVIETVSPSQLIPSEVQRMCTSFSGEDNRVSGNFRFIRNLPLFRSVDAWTRSARLDHSNYCRCLRQGRQPENGRQGSCLKCTGRPSAIV